MPMSYGMLDHARRVHFVDVDRGTDKGRSSMAAYLCKQEPEPEPEPEPKPKPERAVGRQQCAAVTTDACAAGVGYLEPITHSAGRSANRRQPEKRVSGHKATIPSPSSISGRKSAVHPDLLIALERVNEAAERFLKTAPSAKRSRTFAAKWLKRDVGQRARREALERAQLSAPDEQAGGAASDEQGDALLQGQVLDALTDEYKRPMKHMGKVVAQAIVRLQQEVAIRADLDRVALEDKRADETIVDDELMERLYAIRSEALYELRNYEIPIADMGQWRALAGCSYDLGAIRIHILWALAHIVSEDPPSGKTAEDVSRELSVVRGGRKRDTMKDDEFSLP
ncbi:hypothetical protein B484DRAFT_399296 [Ochromonadaceae sp. CCMP2298]|nr:hypothetical protein B484DRAFT_399296 [Ochromonadaceae sp. CCMP2298]